MMESEYLQPGKTLSHNDVIRCENVKDIVIKCKNVIFILKVCFAFSCSRGKRSSFTVMRLATQINSKMWNWSTKTTQRLLAFTPLDYSFHWSWRWEKKFCIFKTVSWGRVYSSHSRRLAPFLPVRTFVQSVNGVSGGRWSGATVSRVRAAEREHSHRVACVRDKLRVFRSLLLCIFILAQNMYNANTWRARGTRTYGIVLRVAAPTETFVDRMNAEPTSTTAKIRKSNGDNVFIVQCWRERCSKNTCTKHTRTNRTFVHRIHCYKI